MMAPFSGWFREHQGSSIQYCDTIQRPMISLSNEACFCFRHRGLAFANYFAHRFALKCFRGAGFNQNRFRTLGPVQKNTYRVLYGGPAVLSVVLLSCLVVLLLVPLLLAACFAAACCLFRFCGAACSASCKSCFEGHGKGERLNWHVLLSKRFRMLPERFRKRGLWENNK